MEWMYWTLPTALFFLGIFCMLASMAVWQKLAPSVQRKGFLPIATHRGDRLFIGLLGSAYIHLIWLGLSDVSLWGALAVSIAWMVTVITKG